jgi:hypothetical protein
MAQLAEKRQRLLGECAGGVVAFVMEGQDAQRQQRAGAGQAVLRDQRQRLAQPATPLAQIATH